jgi:hypothetical protein
MMKYKPPRMARIILKYLIGKKVISPRTSFMESGRSSAAKQAKPSIAQPIGFIFLDVGREVSFT